MVTLFSTLGINKLLKIDLKLLYSMLNTKNTMLFPLDAFLFRMGTNELKLTTSMYIVDFE